MDRKASVMSERSVMYKKLSNEDEDWKCNYGSYKRSPSNSENSYILSIDGKAENIKNNISMGFKIFVIACCMTNLVIVNGFSATLSVLYAELIREFDEDRSLVALISSTFVALVAVGGFLWGYPVKKLGYGYSVVIGGAIGSVAIAASSLTSSVSTIIVLIGVVAGGCFGILYLATFVVAGYVSERYKSILIALVAIGNNIGQSVMPSVMESLIERCYWNGALFILGAMCLNAIPIGLTMHIAEKRLKQNSLQDMEMSSRRNGFYKLYLFKQPIFCILMINSFVFTFTGLAEIRFLVDLTITKGFDRQTGSFFITVFGLGGLAGGLTGPISKALFKLSSAFHMTYWMLIVAATHLMILYLDTYAGLLVTSVLNGFGLANIFSHVAVNLYEIYDEDEYAPAFALWNIFKGAGSLLGGFMGGAIFDITGSYDLLFQICFGLSIFFSASLLGIGVHSKRRCVNKYNRFK